MPDKTASAEQWRAVPDYEEIYEVSSLGRVRSLPRVVAFGSSARQCGGIVLRQGTKPAGYKFVMLYRDAEQKCANVHRLVACAFVEGGFDGAQVNHIDGDKSNNAAENLEWCTGSENCLHSYGIGLRPRGAIKHLARSGERNSQSKLSDLQTEELRAMLSAGASGVEVARSFGISASLVSDIKNGRRRALKVA
ncbi:MULTISPECIES: NUMOD4 domain-containing protein [Pseudomonas]|jgi:hypothetical protein|uniref:NUMOD4 motif protein n=1 Tax=Pseudomonas fluorescens TaxID=294 RepID=A0A125QCS7_PSEFL|nr:MULTISPECIES: NUMOD4 domain-containing protein [Pseudomonas]KRC97688.1 hypothetical protein ASE33_03900 [Pseudomonas sp. Root9]KWV69672.1 NUMOD4 motif protein [Pseudomonas fluorescens]